MTARAQGGVDEDRLGSVRVAAGQCRGEQLDAALQQDRHMAEISWIFCHCNTFPRLGGRHRAPDGSTGRP